MDLNGMYKAAFSVIAPEIDAKTYTEWELIGTIKADGDTWTLYYDKAEGEYRKLSEHWKTYCEKMQSAQRIHDIMKKSDERQAQAAWERRLREIHPEWYTEEDEKLARLKTLTTA